MENDMQIPFEEENQEQNQIQANLEGLNPGALQIVTGGAALPLVGAGVGLVAGGTLGGTVIADHIKDKHNKIIGAAIFAPVGGAVGAGIGGIATALAKKPKPAALETVASKL